MISKKINRSICTTLARQAYHSKPEFTVDEISGGWRKKIGVCDGFQSYEVHYGKGLKLPVPDGWLYATLIISVLTAMWVSIGRSHFFKKKT